MKECFIEKAFKPESRKWIDKMVRVCETYEAQGYKLSLRQVYYQLVAHHGLPNREQSYKNIGSLLSDARLSGLVDWDMIEDRGRETQENTHWDSPAQIVRSCARWFELDKWDDQPYHVEVMVEKAALEGVLQPVCARLDVPFTSNRGYSSSSAMYECGKRLQSKLEAGKLVRIIYLGDHDPSGIDMTRDVDARLSLFSGYRESVDGELELAYDYEDDCDADEPKFKVIRAALNADQIRRYSPPPNPAKLTDSRADGYIRKFGNESWELDALEPSVLAALVEDHVSKWRDEDLFALAVDRQQDHRNTLLDIAEANP